MRRSTRRRISFRWLSSRKPVFTIGCRRSRIWVRIWRRIFQPWILKKTHYRISWMGLKMNCRRPFKTGASTPVRWTTLIIPLTITWFNSRRISNKNSRLKAHWECIPNFLNKGPIFRNSSPCSTDSVTSIRICSSRRVRSPPICRSCSRILMKSRTLTTTTRIIILTIFAK